jgi:hypothetical protein
MKDTVGLLFVSIIPALLGILSIVAENVSPGHEYALKGIGVTLAYMLVVALPVAMIMTSDDNIKYSRWPTWL